MVTKYIKDGLVAVIIAPDDDSGWSTANRNKNAEYLLFDAELVHLVLNNDTKAACAKAKAERLAFTGGVQKLEVQWVKSGTKFKIDEYDGVEVLITVDDLIFTA